MKLIKNFKNYVPFISLRCQSSNSDRFITLKIYIVIKIITYFNCALNIYIINTKIWQKIMHNKFLINKKYMRFNK